MRGQLSASEQALQNHSAQANAKAELLLQSAPFHGVRSALGVQGGCCCVGLLDAVRAALSAGAHHHAELGAWLRDAQCYLTHDFDIAICVLAHRALQRCAEALRLSAGACHARGCCEFSLRAAAE